MLIEIVFWLVQYTIQGRKKQIISIVATTGEEKLYFHVLVPEAKNVESVTASGKTISFKQSKI